MKKTVILLIAMFSIGFIKANPIAPPPVISEFYLVNDSTWYLELVFKKSFHNYTSLNGFKIISSRDTSLVKNGTSINLDSIIVITQDSMQNKIHFNREGDFILLEDSMGWTQYNMYFGNISCSEIFAPKPGQSIVNFADGCWDRSADEPGTQYILVMDNHPTIGYNAFKPSADTGTFKGIVYDLGHHPVPGIYVGTTRAITGEPYYDCGNYFGAFLTNSSGTFTGKEYSVRYPVQVFSKPSKIYIDSTVNIYPDSVNYYVFTIDSLLDGISSHSFQTDITLSCFPNPTTRETTLSFTIPTGKHYGKALIKIYDSNGEIVRILHVNTNVSQNDYSVKWDGICSDNYAAPGIYYCTLELNGQKVATNKIIIAK